MKRKLLCFFALLPFLAVSCDTSGGEGGNNPGQEPEEPAVTITAALESITEGSSSAETTWTAADKIVVFDEDGVSAEFSTATAGATAVFTSADYDAVPVYASYPASAGVTCSEGIFEIEVPAQQAEAALVFVGKTEGTAPDYTLSMKHITGFISVTLQEANVKSIVVEGADGEALAGPVEVDYAKLAAGNADYFTAGEDASASVTFSRSSALAAGSYYISLLPGTFENGLKFTLTFTDDSTIERVIGAEEGITVSRGAVTVIDEILDDLLPETVAFTVNFWNADDAWPFNEEPVGADYRTAAGETYGYDYAYTFGDEEMTRTFNFVLSHGAGDANSEYSPEYRYEALSGVTHPFLFFRTNYGFFKLPAVPGRHLKAVALSHLNTSEKRFRFQENSSAVAADAGRLHTSARIASDGFEPAEISMIFPTEASEFGMAISPEAGKSYYIMLTEGASLRMTSLRVYYTKSLETEFTLPELGPWPEVPVSDAQNEQFGVVGSYGDGTENKGWY